jgi:hypothetical protein
LFFLFNELVCAPGYHIRPIRMVPPVDILSSAVDNVRRCSLPGGRDIGEHFSSGCCLVK